MPRSLARRTLFAAVLLTACTDRDPLDSVTAAPASVGPTGGPSGEPENMSEGTGTSADESSTSGDLPTGTGVTEATLTGSSTSEPSTTEPSTTEPSTTGSSLGHAVDIQPIWDANCVTGCHTPGGTAAAWFVLSSDALANIVGQPSLGLNSMNLVEPGSLEDSYLWHKINDTYIEVGGNGSTMPPLPATKLAPDHLATIAEWIEAGCAP